MSETFAEREVEFAHALLVEARWAIGSMKSDRQSLTRAEVLVEISFFSDRFNELVQRLPTMSPEVAAMQSYDPLDVADYLRPIADACRRSAEEASKREVKRRPSEVQRSVAVELAVRALRICKRYGMPIKTGSTHTTRSSAAVKTLELIGEAARIHLSSFTWRDVITEAREVAPDLR